MQKATIIMTVIVATLAFAAVDALADGEIYRWVDENGTVHFDKQPPANTDAKQVDLQLHQSGVVPSDPTPDQQTEPQVSYAQQQRDERAKKWEENAQKQEISDAACAQRRERVSQLEPFPRVLVTHEDGTTEQMDENERLEMLNDAKAFIAANCDN